MGTCKTCRWWEERHKLCLKRFVDVPTDKREFKSDSMRVSLGNEVGGVETNKCWVHNVFTGPDFGCCHWELSPNVLVTAGNDGKLVVSHIVGTHDGRTVTNNAGEIA
jgi:hypothetical protein